MNVNFGIVLALDSKNGIGKNGCLPWNIKEDLINFSNITRGNIVIMGRKTWDSLPKKPLPKRMNIILSSQPKPSNITDNNVKWISNFNDEILQNFLFNETKKGVKVYCIGGSGLLKYMSQYKYLCNELYIHRIFGDYQCDTFFNINEWIEGKQYKKLLDTELFDKTKIKMVQYKQIHYY